MIIFVKQTPHGKDSIHVISAIDRNYWHKKLNNYKLWRVSLAKDSNKYKFWDKLSELKDFINSI